MGRDNVCGWAWALEHVLGVWHRRDVMMVAGGRQSGLESFLFFSKD